MDLRSLGSLYLVLTACSLALGAARRVEWRREEVRSSCAEE